MKMPIQKIIYIHVKHLQMDYWTKSLNDVWTIWFTLPAILPSGSRPEFTNRACALLPQPWINAISMKLPKRRNPHHKFWKYEKNKYDEVRNISVTRLRVKKLQHARSCIQHGKWKNLMQTWQATNKLPPINLLQANAACQFIFWALYAPICLSRVLLSLLAEQKTRS